MAITTFNIFVENFQGIQHVLDKYGHELSDLRKLWGLLEKYLAPVNAIKIFTEGQRSWPRYKDEKDGRSKYRTWKHKHGKYRTLLRKDGNLYQGFAQPGSEHNLSDKKPQQWDYGVDLSHEDFRSRKEYPALHNTGAGHLPKREWAFISEWMMRRQKIFFYRYVQGIMKGKPVKL